jgi:hypothetical protein
MNASLTHHVLARVTATRHISLAHSHPLAPVNEKHVLARGEHMESTCTGWLITHSHVPFRKRQSHTENGACALPSAVKLRPFPSTSVRFRLSRQNLAPSRQLGDQKFLANPSFWPSHPPSVAISQRFGHDVQKGCGAFLIACKLSSFFHQFFFSLFLHLFAVCVQPVIKLFIR